MKGPVFLILLPLLFCACKNKTAFTRSASGMEYQVVQHDATGISAKPGDYLKLSVKQCFGDTVLRDPLKTGYEYQLIDSTQMTKEAWALFHDACVNDSIVFRVSSDSAFKNHPPSFVKKKGWLVTTVKIIAILPNADSVEADRERERERARHSEY